MEKENSNIVKKLFGTSKENVQPDAPQPNYQEIQHQPAQQPLMEKMYSTLLSMQQQLNVLNKNVLMMQQQQTVLQEQVRVLKEDSDVNVRRSRETSVVTRNVEKQLNKVFGMEKTEEEEFVECRLPIPNEATFSELEEVLGNIQYESAFKIYVGKHTKTHDIDGVYKVIMTDDCSQMFNWEGTFGKQPLKQSIIFSKILFDLFPMLPRAHVTQEIKRCVDRAHRRLSSKMRRTRPNL